MSAGQDRTSLRMMQRFRHCRKCLEQRERESAPGHHLGSSHRQWGTYQVRKWGRHPFPLLVHRQLTPPGQQFNSAFARTIDNEILFMGGLWSLIRLYSIIANTWETFVMYKDSFCDGYNWTWHWNGRERTLTFMTLPQEHWKVHNHDNVEKEHLSQSGQYSL